MAHLRALVPALHYPLTEKKFPDVQRATIASHYTVWHYQEQFGFIILVTALQTVTGTYTSYPRLTEK